MLKKNQKDRWGKLQKMVEIGYDEKKKRRWRRLVPTKAVSLWFPYNPKPHTALPRLFCFPYGGGNAVIFRQWQHYLVDDIDVYPVQLPGRGMRMQEPSYQKLEPLIKEMATAFQPHLDRPYSLFGHSMGALIAFELARYLQKNFQSSPKHVIVSGFRAPHLPDPKPPIHKRSNRQFVEEIAKMNGTPKEILENPEYLELFLPSLRADFQLCETYTYHKGEPLRAPLTAFGGKQDPEVTEEMLKAWKMHTAACFKLVSFSGDHFFIHREEEAVVRQIRKIIKGA